MVARQWMISALAFGLMTEPLPAQDSTRALPSGTALGLTVDRFSFNADGEGSYTSATLHVSALKPNSFAPELSLSFFPGFLSDDFGASLVTGVDVGGAYNVPFPDGVLLFRAGASGLFSLGRDNTALPGAHAGASVLIKALGNTAIRLDVVSRWYLVPFALGVPTLTIGVGISSLPR
jgi:hypothetical protein